MKRKSTTPLKVRPSLDRIKTVIRQRTGEEGETEPCQVTRQYDSQQFQTQVKDNQIRISNEVEQTEYQFAFDKVLTPETSQKAFFRESGVEEMMRKVLDGYNGFVFAYGQSGTGKTYTLGLQHHQSQPGLISNAAHMLFSQVAQRKRDFQDYSIEIQVGVLEVYCEQIYDLLDCSQQAKTSRPRKDSSTKKQGCKISIESLDQFQQIVELCVDQRRMSEQQLNSKSSRSHLIITLHLNQSYCTPAQAIKIQSQLRFIDLAGTEKLKQSKSQGVQMQEAKSINQSLTNLRSVIQSLKHNGNSPFIPFSNGKFTKIIQESLNQNSLIIVVGCINQKYVKESIHTLRYVYECSQIKITPLQNYSALNTEAKTSPCLSARDTPSMENEYEKQFQQRLQVMQDNYNQKERIIVKRMMSYEEQLDSIRVQLGGQSPNINNDALLAQSTKIKQLEERCGRLQHDYSLLQQFNHQLLDKFISFLDGPDHASQPSDQSLESVIQCSKEKAKYIVESINQVKTTSKAYKAINDELLKIILQSSSSFLQQHGQKINSIFHKHLPDEPCLLSSVQQQISRRLQEEKENPAEYKRQLSSLLGPHVTCPDKSVSLVDQSSFLRGINQSVEQDMVLQENKSHMNGKKGIFSRHARG